MIAAAQTTSQYNFDESRLGRVRALITDLKTRLDVSEKLVNVEGQFHDQIPLDETAPTNITEQVSNYFQAEKAKVQPAAKEGIQKDAAAEVGLGRGGAVGGSGRGLGPNHGKAVRYFPGLVAHGPRVVPAQSVLSLG